ncbi:MAG: ABC transporter permease [Spirochaetia bacterium]|jgi:peptide/nickel transport system permease protein|nr:ABC transporter permease [Spirochaetia bacterium]
MGIYFRNKSFTIGFCCIASIVLLMLVGLIYLPYDPNTVDISSKLQGLSRAHLLGCDHLGRDILSRLMVGARISLSLGCVVVALSFVVGTPLGAFAGYFGGKVDAAVTKVIDTLMSFPGILLALMFVAVLSANYSSMVMALSLMGLPRFARVARGGFMAHRNQTYVLSAKARGAGSLRIMVFHILPHIKADILNTCSISFASAVMSEAGLSYLGLGIQPPTPSFGKMLSDAQPYILVAPHYILAPAVVLVILVLGFNLLGSGLREVQG